MDQANLEHWETLAAFHGTGRDRYYDLDRVVAGGTLMGDAEAAALELATRGGSLDGVDVLHLQCHVGADAITLARAGARVTGVDFSPIALARLSSLAAACGVEVTTVLADARDLPGSLNDSFDLVYASIGVLNWIDDLDAWMSGVARVVRHGGALALVALHPLLAMIDPIEPLVLDFPYNFDGPHAFEGTGSYANRDADVAWRTVQCAHGVAEVVTAAQRAGLRLRHLIEHTSMDFDPRAATGAGVESDGRFRVRLGDPASGASGAEPVPVLFTLVAERVDES